MRVLLFFCGLLFMTSCQKELLTNSSISTRSPVDPDEYDGMLWFDDFDHLDSYYDHLDTLISNPAVFDLDSMLELYESNFSYTSLRSVLYVDGFESGKSPVTTVCVVDDVRRSILNDEFELRIGDSIYVVYSINQTFSFPYTMTNVVDRFRDADKGGLDDTFPWDLYTNGVTLISPTKVLAVGQVSSIINPPIILRSPPFELEVLASDVECEPRQKRIETNVKDEGNIFAPNTTWSTLTIDFGEGNGPETITNHGSFIHTYQSDGDFEITGVGTIIWSEGGITTTYNLGPAQAFVNTSSECLFTPDQCPDPVIVDNGGNRGMESKIWLTRDIFGQHIGARTTSLKKIGGDWKHRNATTVYALVQGDWRNRSSCDDNSVNFSQTKWNARNVRVSEKVYYRCNGDYYWRCITLLDEEMGSTHWVSYPGPPSGILNDQLMFQTCE